MKIDGTDASTFSSGNLRSADTPVREARANIKDKQVVIEQKNLSQLSNFEKKELPVSEKVMIDAIERANRAISGANRRFEFSIHEKTKEIMIKVIDSDTDQVIREIPPEKILDMVAKMWEMAGLIVDERR